ncbi:unnamed protein product [Amoebophrya sp. A120]|nr:unnamed protein product [Amoebophrya sp. A120]|eukprot:GSA120T00011163001.1
MWAQLRRWSIKKVVLFVPSQLLACGTSYLLATSTG